MNLYAYSDYREYIRDKIAASKAVRGYQTILAKAARCQPSLLSLVIRSQGHLTRDHLAELAGYWGMDEDQTDYLLGLLELAKTSSRRMRAHQTARLAALKSKQVKLSSRFSDDVFQPTQIEAVYYSAWFWSAVHVMVSIPQYNETSEIAARLGLPENIIDQALTKLTKMGFIIRKGNRWSVTKKSIHLPPESFMNAANHINWRQRSIFDIQAGHQESMHYSSVFVMSRKDAELVKTVLLNAIDAARKISIPSPEEEVYCLNSDFFVV